MEVKVIKQLDPKEFGLEKEKVQSIEDAFTPKIIEREALKVQYEELITQELTETLCKDAKKLRNKLVKVRTGISDVHKTQKAFFLASGKFVDAWKNKETLPVSQMEEKLSEVEHHFEQLEEERRVKLRQSRLDSLSEFDGDGQFMDLINMPEESFQKHLQDIKSSYEAKIKADKEAEEQRKAEFKRIEDELIAKKKADKIERERIEKENEKLKKAVDEQNRISKLNTDRWNIIAEKGLISYVREKELGSLTESEFDKLIKDNTIAQQQQFDYDNEQLRKGNIESERLRKIEADKWEKEERKRIEEDVKKEAESDRLAQIETDLKKGDTIKVRDLVIDLQELKDKYEFKSAKNKKMYSGVNEMIDKMVTYIGK